MVIDESDGDNMTDEEPFFLDEVPMVPTNVGLTKDEAAAILGGLQLLLSEQTVPEILNDENPVLEALMKIRAMMNTGGVPVRLEYIPF